MRAALLVSHGLRRDTVVYLVLLGGPEAPRTLRVDGAAVKFLRPDERSLAVLAQKALSDPRQGDGFVEVRPGVSGARAAASTALGDLGACALYLLEEGGAGNPVARSSPRGAWRSSSEITAALMRPPSRPSRRAGRGASPWDP